MANIASRAEYQTFIGKAATIKDADLGLLGMLMPLVERTIKQHVGFNIVQTTYTDELYPTHAKQLGGGDFLEVSGGKVLIGRSRGASNQLQLQQLPVRSITTIHEDLSADSGDASGAFAAATLLTLGTDFYIDRDIDSGISWSGILVRKAAGWSAIPRTIKTTYIAGLTEAELNDEYSDIKLASLYAMGKFFNEIKTNQDSTGLGAGAVLSRSMGDTSVTFDSGAQTANSGLTIDLPATSKVLLQKYVHYGRLWM